MRIHDHTPALWLSFFFVLSCGQAVSQMQSDRTTLALDDVSFEGIRFSNSAYWAIGRSAVELELIDAKGFAPEHRSPRGIAVLPWKVSGDFRFEVEALQSGREYGHRDLCLFFDMRSPTEFRYVHLSTAADANAHHVQEVAEADRSPITTARNEGVDWGRGEWRRLILQRVGNSLAVYFDGDPRPCLEAELKDSEGGFLGLGSFDDSGRFRHPRLTALPGRVVLETPGFFAKLDDPARKPGRRSLIHGEVRRLSSDGGWCWFEGPRALFSASKLVVGSVASGWLDKARRGDVELLVHDLRTGRTRGIELADRLEPDDHDQPGLLELVDGRLLAVYSKHGPESRIRVHRSEPGDPTRWEAARIVVPSKSSRVTYSNLVRLAGENHRVYDFFRGLDGAWKPSWIYSDDGGESWRRGGILIDVPGRVKHRPYVCYADDGESTIHFAYTEGHPRNFDNSIYHAMYRGGALWRGDDQRIGALTRGLKSPQEGRLVFQGGADAVAWITDLVVDPDRRPRMLFSVQKDGAGKPPGSGGEDHRFHYAHQTASGWQVEEVAHAGRRLYRGEDDYTGLGVVIPGAEHRIVISTDAHPATGEPLVNDEGRRSHELFLMARREAGRWSARPLTENSVRSHLRPIVASAPDDGGFWLIWLHGDYRSYTDYAQEVLAMPLPR